MIINKVSHGINIEFDIQNDGITYTPLIGDGTEKDKDFFISWESLQILFIEERNRNASIIRYEAPVNPSMPSVDSSTQGEVK